MPTPNYSNSVIYMLRHQNDSDLENIYIGSTTNFRIRKFQHKSICSNQNSKDYNNNKYQYIRENGGWDEWLMVPIEEYPCNSLVELRAREDVVMLQYANRLNAYRASRNVKEWREDNKTIILEKSKEKYKNNTEIINLRSKTFYENNKKILVEKSKKNYESNRDKKLEQRKRYYQENKQKISEKEKEKITCECGCEVRRNGLSDHIKSAKHLQLLNSIS